MWKYVSRRIRETLERNAAAAHFDRLGCANSSSGCPDDKNKRSPPCRWYASRCRDWNQNDNNTNNNEWGDLAAHFERLGIVNAPKVPDDKRSSPCRWTSPWCRDSHQLDNITNNCEQNAAAAHFDRRSTGFGNFPNVCSDDKDKRSPARRWYSSSCRGSYHNKNKTNNKEGDTSAEHFNTLVFENSPNDDKDKQSPSCRWYKSRCSNSDQNENNTNNSNRWNFEHLNRSWIGAITWSSALVLGWYANQFLHLRNKYQLKEPSKKCPTISGIFSALYPYVKYVKKDDGMLRPAPIIENVLKTFTPTVHLITNEHDGENKNDLSSGVSSRAANPNSTENDLGEVLNSIENKLGLAAIESGHHQDGLNLLRSAANRNHAPALYNLGLCYELGLGVAIDEKAAMELYRSAAAREHPAALFNLGIYYGQGRGGLTRDKATATRLLRLAAVQGQEDAIKALETLEEETVEPKQNSADETWTYSYPSAPYLHSDSNNVAPSQSSLFVENAQLLRPQIY